MTLLIALFTYFLEHALESGEQAPGTRGAELMVALDAPGRAHWRRHGNAAHKRNTHQHKIA